MPKPLLSTKFYIPTPRQELVPRPRLIERLDQGMNSKLTLISDPAGSGKTTLLSDARCSVQRNWAHRSKQGKRISAFCEGVLVEQAPQTPPNSSF